MMTRTFGDTPVPAEAKRFHDEARAAGARGDYERAAELFGEAHMLAPDWPYPIYDMAFTYLMVDRPDDAEVLYAEVDAMMPDGFFTCKTSLYTLRRELSGALPAGFSKAFATLEWMPDPEQKKTILAGMTRKFPAFAPAWRELSALLPDPAERLHALNQGLAAYPDPETKGMLVLNKATVLAGLGARAEARQLLGGLMADTETTTAGMTLARELLGRLDQYGPI
jgi:hypothetical protein